MRDGFKFSPPAAAPPSAAAAADEKDSENSINLFGVNDLTAGGHLKTQIRLKNRESRSEARSSQKKMMRRVCLLRTKRIMASAAGAAGC